MTGNIIKRSLSEQAYSLIVEKIQNGEIKPGQRLNIEELTKEFGISRTPVREAISMLTQNGFVEQIHNVGPKVITLDMKNTTDLIETNSLLLEGVANSVFDNSDTKMLSEKLSQVVNSQKKAFEKDDCEEFLANSILFNEIFIDACPNNKLKQLADQTQKQVDVWFGYYQENQEMKILGLKQHEKLVELLRDNKKEEFVKLLAEHNEKPLKYFSQLKID